jgi:aryl-alcohol dehydrogenase-like predicted oxidoreductase
MKLVIGTANFLRKYSYTNQLVGKEEIVKILNFAYSKKIKSIDTAFEYDKFYQVSKEVDLNRFEISSKINFTKQVIKKIDFEKKYFNIIINRLKLFKIKKFENLFVHNFDELDHKDLKKIKLLFLKLKKEKIINNIGISIYDVRTLNKIKYFDCINIVQTPINLFDRRFIKKNISNFLKKKNIKLQARSIFLQGFLLEKLENLTKTQFKKNKTFKSYNSWINKKNRQPLKTCLDFIKSQTNIYNAVVGINNIQQLKEIVKLTRSKKKLNFPKKILTSEKKIIDPRKW